MTVQPAAIANAPLQTLGGNAITIQWGPLANGDTGSPVSVSDFADRSAQKAVGPVQQLSTQDRAAVNYANALNHKFVDGEPVADEKFIRAAFDALPPEYRADKSIADITTVIAAGLQALDERQSGRSRRGTREPDFREGATGRSRNTTSDAIDAFDSAAARASGKTPEQWKAIQKSFGGDSGGGRILEDV